MVSTTKREQERLHVRALLDRWPEGGGWQLVPEDDGVAETPDALLLSAPGDRGVGLEVVTGTIPHLAEAHAVEQRLIDELRALLCGTDASPPPTLVTVTLSGAAAIGARGRTDRVRCSLVLAWVRAQHSICGLTLQEEFLRGSVTSRAELLSPARLQPGYTLGRLGPGPLAGHVAGTELATADRTALIDFLETL